MKKYLLKFVMIILFLSYFHSGNIYSQIMVYDVPLDTVAWLVKEYPSAITNINSRCVEPDSVMLTNDYFFLYYGSAFLKSYRPYAESMFTTELNKLYEDQNYNEIISKAKKHISENPAYVEGYYSIGVAYSMIGDSINSKAYIERYVGLLKVPFYSGNGKSEDSAFVVRSINDEYLIIRELGYVVSGQALIYSDKNIPFDVMTCKEPDAQESESIKLYFNIYAPFEIGMTNVFKNSTDKSDENESSSGEKDKKKKKKKDK